MPTEAIICASYNNGNLRIADPKGGNIKRSLGPRSGSVPKTLPLFLICEMRVLGWVKLQPPLQPSPRWAFQHGE